jgi:hypothetical protein
MTPLEAATEAILAAIGKKDLKEVQAAIRERARLLASKPQATVRAWELGEQASRNLASLKQDLILELSRLEQIRKICNSLTVKSPPRRQYMG